MISLAASWLPFFTNTHAIRRLLHAAKSSQVEIRYSSHPKFHAKAYGFRRSKGASPTVLLGSANLTEGATAVDSGELGIRLDGNTLASEAWDVLEGFWEQGRTVTTRWLADYESKFNKLEAKRAAARKAQSRWWKTRLKGGRQAKPDLTKEKFFVVSTSPMPKAEQDELKAAAKTVDLELPTAYYWYSQRKEADRIPRDRQVVELLQTVKQDRIKAISVVRVRRPFLLVDPSDNSKNWIVPSIPTRGGTLVIPVSKAAVYEKRLKALGLSWSKLAAMEGGLRGRRRLFLQALKALGWKSQ